MSALDHDELLLLAEVHRITSADRRCRRWPTVTTEPTTDQQDDDPEPETVRPVMRLWREAKAKSKDESQARRARVLGHDDLAQRLTLPPLRLSHPARWSGWIPPRLLAEESCAHCGPRGDRRCRDQPHRARVHDSPIRRQLVEIATEAMARESGR
jgi:hypothetical protein